MSSQVSADATDPSAPEAGPSRTPSVQSGRSGRSARSVNSVTSSRKGKERAEELDDSNDGTESESERSAVNGAASMSSHASQRSSRRDKHQHEHASAAVAVSDLPEDESMVTDNTRNGAHEEDDDDDDDEDEEEEEEEEEDEEPALKYSRLKGQLPQLLGRDSATAIDVSQRVMAIGTQVGMVHVMTYEGSKIDSYRGHGANVTCLRLDEENEFLASTGYDGRVIIKSLTSTENHAFEYNRPMRAIALEPGFAKKASRAFICGGLAGNLIMQEKGWLGYKEQIIHSGEGPIYAIEWRGNLIAWANDLGVKIYDTTSGQRIGYIDRGANAPRAELFKCSLQWKDDTTLVIGWADHIKVVRVRPRSRGQAGLPPLTVVMSEIYQVDCMISGIAQFKSSFIILAYIAPDLYDNEHTDDREEQRRKAANRPELRIIEKGEEASADALSLANFHRYGCNDYALIKSKRPGAEVFYVTSPSDIIVVRPRDEADHIEWLVDRQRYQEALTAAEELQKQHGPVLDVKAIGVKYIRHLLNEKQYQQAAQLAPRVLGRDTAAWEEWINVFANNQQLPAIIPYIPTKDPQLGRSVYEMVFDYLLLNDRPALLNTIITWPTDVYDLKYLLAAIQSELGGSKDDPVLLECLGELYLAHKQPAKALPYFLRLRRPHVFDLIREYNLFTAVQDQALLLVEFDRERKGIVDKRTEVQSDTGKHGAAIQLLVDHTHSIPIDRVIHQLEPKPQFLYMYLDALFDKDPQFCHPYSDRMVELYAAFDMKRLMPFLRASNYYDLEKAYNICKERDYVPEMVFLLGRMGNNKQALMLIIERLGDVQRAIDFAKEQADEDLWEDLLQYSETRPDFIRALLEHVGAEINPIRLISRIRNGLEIPGLKPALIKVLQASNLQVSLLEGCQHILSTDCSALATELQFAQTAGARAMPTSICQVCTLPAFPPTANLDLAPVVLIYLCRHTVHAACALPHADIELPLRQEHASVSQLLSSDNKRSLKSRERELSSKLSYAAAIRVRVGRCPVCTPRRNEVRPAHVRAQSLIAAQA